MGMPLQQCKQKFHFMSPELRSHFRHEIIGPIAKEFGFDDPPPVFKVSKARLRVSNMSK
jgi:hypothetical protein